MARWVVSGGNVTQWVRVTHNYLNELNFSCARRLVGLNGALNLSNNGSAFFSQNVGTKPDGNNKVKRAATYTKISLIDIDGKFTVTSLEEAEKLAKRRDLKLVKTIDTAKDNQRSVYQLMTATQYFEKELKERKTKNKTTERKEKILSISDKIERHDLQSKLNMIEKWLGKNYEIRVILNETEETLSAPVFKSIEDSIKDLGKIVQKRQKAKEIKFSILPVKRNGSSQAKSNTN